MINLLIDATLIFSVVYFGFSLVASLHDSLIKSEAPIEALEAPSIEIDSEAPYQDLEAPSSPCYSSMTVTELRKVCSSLDIVWRDVYGKNKHLKKSEMLALIMV